MPAPTDRQRAAASADEHVVDSGQASQHPVGEIRNQILVIAAHWNDHWADGL